MEKLPRHQLPGQRRNIMKQQWESYAGRLAAKIQNISADMDPDILQLPGGSVIATLLWLYAKGTVVFRRH